MSLDRQAKNRIVGIIVLTALGAMFLPDLLDGEKVKVEEQFATISLRPEVRPSAPPDGAFDFGPTADIEPPVVIPESSSQPQIKPAPAISKPSSAVAGNMYGWTLQVGTFGKASNVAILLEKLRSAGYVSYSVPSTPIDGQLTRVFVGPELSEQKLQQIQAHLKKEYNLNGQLQSYEPTQF